MRNGPSLYSQMVAVLKVGLPLIAIGLLSALFLIQNDDGIGGEISFTEGDLEALGSGLRVTNPTLTGTTTGADRFRFTAEVVVPDAAPPTRASITTLAGAVDLQDGRRIELRADAGELDLPDQRLLLTGGVDITTSDGYRMQTSRMQIDLRAGAIEAPEPVSATGPLGEIDSGSLSVAPASDDGAARLFSFGNGVRVLYDPPPQ